jgi:pyruvate/2-oxoglutarate dehydrogenase complex dihydrolipoamide dehydrogenase (E3) component
MAVLRTMKELSMLKMLSPGTLPWPRRVAIIGAGTMGLGVAEAWIAAGVSVTLVDATPEQTEQAQAQLAQRVQRHAEAGLVVAPVWNGTILDARDDCDRDRPSVTIRSQRNRR